MNPAREIVPPGVVTTTLPEVPLATTAVMLVALTTVNLGQLLADDLA